MRDRYREPEEQRQQGPMKEQGAVRAAGSWLAKLVPGILVQPLILVALAALAYLAWYLRTEVVVLFASVLFGVGLYRAARWLVDRTGMPHGAAVGIWYAVALGLMACFFLFAGQSLTDQYGKFGERLPAALETVENRVAGVPVVGSVAQQLGQMREDLTDGGGDGEDGGRGDGGEETSDGAGSDSGSDTLHLVQLTLRTLSLVGLVVLLTFYLAYDGRRYVDGLLRLVPDDRRPVAEDLAASLGTALPWWLVGRLASMLVVVALTAPALYLLGVPLALLLALIAGLFSFVPVLGPIVSVIPAVLVTVESAPSKLVWVLLLYAVVQVVESWFITPVIQDKVASTSPFLVLAAQLVMGTLVGIVGIMFATPLALAALVSVQVLYLRHGLGQEVETPSYGSG